MSESVAVQVESQSGPLTAFRLVQWSTLAALAWKIGAFIQMWKCYFSTPLRQEFFPAALESPILLVAVYVGVILTLGISAMSESRRRRLIAAWSTLVLISILCVHKIECEVDILNRNDMPADNDKSASE